VRSLKLILENRKYIPVEIIRKYINARKVFRFFAEWLTDYPQVRTAYIDVVKNEIKGVNV